MCDFKPGDEVVCVDDGAFAGSISHTFIRKGCVYQVEGFDGFCETTGAVRVFLVGVDADDHPSTRASFLHTRFRKVERKNDSLSIEAFLTIKPGQYEEPKRTPAKKRERV